MLQNIMIPKGIMAADRYYRQILNASIKKPHPSIVRSCENVWGRHENLFFV